VDGLTDVLPFQRDLNFRQELVCFLCNALEAVSNGDRTHPVPDGVVTPLNAPLAVLKNVLAAWLASGTLLLLYWTRLDAFSSVGIAVHGLLAFVLMCAPMGMIKVKDKLLISYILLSIFAILTSLALFAFVNHSGVDQRTVDLASFGYDQTVIRIEYPKWLTIDEIQSCDETNAVSVLMTGDRIRSSLGFDLDTSLLTAKNKDCQAITPRADKDNASGTAYTFYAVLLDRESLDNSTTIITPTVEWNNQLTRLEDYQMEIQIEQLHWGIFRQALVYIASAGGLTLFALVAQLVAFSKR
jgi:hypothetical protein